MGEIICTEIRLDFDSCIQNVLKTMFSGMQRRQGILQRIQTHWSGNVLKHKLEM